MLDESIISVFFLFLFHPSGLISQLFSLGEKNWFGFLEKLQRMILAEHSFSAFFT